MEELDMTWEGMFKRAQYQMKRLQGQLEEDPPATTKSISEDTLILLSTITEMMYQKWCDEAYD